MRRQSRAGDHRQVSTARGTARDSLIEWRCVGPVEPRFWCNWVFIHSRSTSGSCTQLAMSDIVLTNGAPLVQ